MALARHHEHLSRAYQLTCQPLEVVSRIVDKDPMHALAGRVGLDAAALLRRGHRGDGRAG